ncbi:MAG TPA: hypothetical protein VMI06_07725, partial [Terriglobia bacterium]|nr:hypothetical protein [Terriglobia bacterium]
QFPTHTWKTWNNDSSDDFGLGLNGWPRLAHFSTAELFVGLDLGFRRHAEFWIPIVRGASVSNA